MTAVTCALVQIGTLLADLLNRHCGQQVTNFLRDMFPNSTFMAVGWSLGANILLRYLGEEGEKAPFIAAASLCECHLSAPSQTHLRRWSVSRVACLIHQCMARLLGLKPEPTITAFVWRAGNPFNLPISNANFERGFNRFYDYRLAQSLSNIFKCELAPVLLLRKAICCLWRPERESRRPSAAHTAQHRMSWSCT